MDKATIFEAAELLLAETGKEPSVRDVLRKIGRGSLSEITPAMKEWRTERKELEAKRVAMPESMQNIASSFVDRLWLEANLITQKSIEQTKAGYDAEIEKRDHAEAELLEELEQTHGQVLELQDEIARLNEKLNGVLELEREKARISTLLEVAEQEKLTLRASLDEYKTKNDELLKSLSDLAAASLQTASNQSKKP